MRTLRGFSLFFLLAACGEEDAPSADEGGTTAVASGQQADGTATANPDGAVTTTDTTDASVSDIADDGGAAGATSDAGEDERVPYGAVAAEYVYQPPGADTTVCVPDEAVASYEG